jgi:peptide/nickel transport system substrate-binding protein
MLYLFSGIRDFPVAYYINLIQREKRRCRLAMKRFLLATLAVITIIGMLVSSCGEAAPAEAPEAAAPEAAAVPEVPESPEAAPEAAAPTTGPKYGGTMKILTAYSPGLDIGWPAELTWVETRAVYYTCFEPLIRYYRDGSIEPMLATDWELAPDYLSVTLYLREGVKFHDGTDFKADAVKLMVEANIAEEGQAENWDSADIIDDYTVRINFNEYRNTFWYSLGSLACMIISPTAYETNGKDWMRRNPVGTGPFKFVELERDQYVKFEKFDDYWQEGKPYLDGFELITIVDATTLQMAFLAGEGYACDTQEAKAMFDMAARGYDIIHPLMGTAMLIPDNDPDSPWADKRVREAIEHAIDKEAIAQVMGYGLYEASGQLCPPGFPGWNPDIVGRDYDPDKARELLDEALGVGVGFKTDLVTMSAWTAAPLMMMRNLEEVGIKCTLKAEDPMSYFSASYSGWKGLFYYCHGTGTHVASGIRGVFPPYGANVSMIVPEGLGDLEDAAITTPDYDEQIELTHQILQLIADEAVVIPAYADSLGYVASPKVHDADWMWTDQTHAWRTDNAWIED